jgi:UTP--glucose-1-phosphate uridylyltransferase
LGTRFLPATKAMPKEMLPVVDAPAIQYVVEEAVNAGLNDVLDDHRPQQARAGGSLRQCTCLERTLELKGDQARLDSVQHASGLGPIHYVRQGEPKGLGPCSPVRPPARG